MKYTQELLGAAVLQSSSVAGVLRTLGLPVSGGAHTHVSRRIKQFGIDTSHFTGQAHQKGLPPRNRMHWTEILVRKPEGSNRQAPKRLRRALIESGRPHTCEGCGMEPEWCGHPLIFHVDHIDGNPTDSRPQNVRFLCPNCHSQTPTWAGRRRFSFDSDQRGS
ncbi:HNH endonuclease signature motif containing protein [Rhodococcus yananensis]|uniref:HNH endonuclease signature motif containing protein n=1 Tax=Rhodococcus yananensis TaxID=2879464 RepID=UPI001CF8FEAC|nr:HNH endonuclease [Rhodococcus yananensis]